MPKMPQERKKLRDLDLLIRVMEAKNGDRAAMDDVVRSMMGLVNQMAARYSRKYSSTTTSAAKDDFRQAGIIGVYRAVTLYESGRGKFATYAWQWIRANVAKAAEKECSSRSFSLNEKICDDSEDEYIDVVEDNSPSQHEKVELSELEEIVREEAEKIKQEIPKRSVRNVLELRILAEDPVTFDEMGALSGGYSRQRAQQIEKNIMRMLASRVAERLNGK